MKRGRKTALYRRGALLRGPHEEAEIQRKAVREKLGLQQKYMFRKGKSAVEGDPKESWSGVETEAGVE